VSSRTSFPIIVIIIGNFHIEIVTQGNALRLFHLEGQFFGCIDKRVLLAIDLSEISLIVDNGLPNFSCITCSTISNSV
jgi:hypothetical protein